MTATQTIYVFKVLDVAPANYNLCDQVGHRIFTAINGCRADSTIGAMRL